MIDQGSTCLPHRTVDPHGACPADFFQAVGVVGYRRGLFLSGFDTRKQLLLSDPLSPDDYELRVGGPKIVPEVIPFEIRAGEKTELRVAAALGKPLRFELTLPKDAVETRHLQFRIKRGDDFEFSRRLRRLPSALFVVETGLAPGRYSLRAHSKNGHKAQLELEVVDAEGPRTIRLNLQ